MSNRLSAAAQSDLILAMIAIGTSQIACACQRCFRSKCQGVVSFVCAAAASVLLACDTPGGERISQVATSRDATVSLPGALASAILEDAGQHLQAPTPAPEITLVEATAWPDDSLGCHGVKTAAARATPGYRVHVTAGALEFEYHADRQREFRLCSIRGRHPPIVVDPMTPPVE